MGGGYGIGVAPSKTFNLAGLAFSNIIIRNPVLRAAFKGRDKLFGMVNPSIIQTGLERMRDAIRREQSGR